MPVDLYSLLTENAPLLVQRFDCPPLQLLQLLLEQRGDVLGHYVSREGGHDLVGHCRPKHGSKSRPGLRLLLCYDRYYAVFKHQVLVGCAPGEGLDQLGNRLGFLLLLSCRLCYCMEEGAVPLGEELEEEPDVVRLSRYD